jgi:cytidylate kinase
MNDLFLKYMSNRLIDEYEKDPIHAHQSELGPVITISRETGCAASVISKKLYDRIQTVYYPDKLKPGPWQILDKEVLHIAAQTLEVNPYELNYAFKGIEKSAIHEVLNSLSSKYYHSDRKVKRTIVNVIRDIAERGHVIFIGRGTVAVTRDMENSLHIRLVAPLDWRIHQFANRYNMTLDKAAAFIKDSDARRTKLIECFGGKNETTQFDVIYNTAFLSQDEIANQMFALAKYKGFFK